MMVYLDTNVLIYASVNQGTEKKRQALDLIERLIDSETLMLSTLVLQEFVFTLAKLKISNEIIKRDSDFYFGFVGVEYDYGTLREAVDSCCQGDSCKNINDIIHLYLAQKSKCKKLITFDKDFKKLAPPSTLKIEILS
ncbi:type II toxin-antitoxin system VapC family toxin [Sulfurovum sp.]|uniref:type II toxin-antitoxin system VapC family toxin n=1 Tax=Sulfurovum sp. TaxID=1969726 RepID=UPI00175B808A|nr:type II toxin-antitoxin system VapC family toxin [Sulfurovum sp.]HHH37209.1 type II toxin-antitoxin system VapC family toxin [Campylobacterota bacterium]